MPYSFFFSYAHQDNDDFIKRFHKELSKAVRQKGGETEGGKVSFFDQEEMFGTQWNPELVRAAQLSRVMVCVYSPSYFGSPNCGREWKLFDLRREFYLKQQRDAGEDNSIQPPVILPVIWRQPPSPLPGPVAGVDPYLGGKDALYNVEGMYKVTRLNKSRFDAEFLDFVEKLSDEIVKRGRRYRLPELPAEEYGDFNALPSAFDEDPPAPAPAGDGLVITEPKTLGPNSVQFVFVAGSPAEFAAAEMAKRLGYKRQPQPYVKNGGRDWRPYDPEKRIRPYVTNIATGPGLEFDVDEMPFDEHLDRQIDEASRRRNLVIILVDSWTLDLEKYESTLRSLHIYSNCSILIPWNEKDPDLTQEQRARLEKKVRGTFDNWWRVAKPLYFCYTIHSADDFDNKVRETLKALRDSFVNEVIADSTQDIPRALDSSITKPDISNK